VNKKIGIIGMTGLALFLASCDMLPDPVDPAEQQVPENEEGTSEEDTASEDPNIVEIQVDSDYYRPVINEDGTYETSQNRGITTRLNSNINMKLFEDDLMRLAHEYFSTEDHFFQEGQFLPGNLAQTWLQRQSEDNEEGLNPESTGNDPESRTPNYLESILEHNYYVQTDEGLELAGVTIGLAMNTVDYYQAEQFGPTQEQEISSEELIQEGQRIADEVVSRMREMEGLGNVPIMVGLYEQATRDDLAGGVYVMRGLSDNGSGSVSGWTELDEERLIFPIEGMESAEGNAFANFQSEVSNFFPNLSGIVGRAHRVNEGLVSLEIEIMTQFYGKGEMIAFTQYLNEAATTYLPANVTIEIKVESLNGTEAFLQRNAGEDEFDAHIFN
jgi:protein involved in sex pheromone biosynthesis